MHAYDTAVPRCPQIDLDEIYSDLDGRFIGSECILGYAVVSAAVRDNVNIAVPARRQRPSFLLDSTGAMDGTDAQETEDKICNHP